MSHYYSPEGYQPQFQATSASEAATEQQQQAEFAPHNSQFPPGYVPPAYYGQPHGTAGQSIPPSFYPPHMTPSHGHYPYPPQYYPPHYYAAHQGYHPMCNHPHMMHPAYIPPQVPPTQPSSTTEDNGQFMEQAQAMLEQALGEDAGMFKDILGSLGMNDKEFWKGAMIGAAAALLLSNDKVRGKLFDVVSGAGDMLKTGGSKVKDAASHTAQNVKENVTNSGEIFKDTYSAGKQGFNESVERHYHPAEAIPAAQQEQAEDTTTATKEVTPA
ncbi:YtxH domain-containing protein [Shewanella fidelis]|uniref:YtxH domain-containing protein n=1 Tax=Shewanella fidelis TaxID=173509 RepID=A0AAW8NG88_9GAMM|nr:hypothetical protein [Shewanella fidelis]MDR8522347.1 hypothetical protein [Shewanella fidelis]MDW4812437.1 hypothetical protein [Shewanella fidelis]MDW4816184.1 hypothetical protein [Shewanella fidelis]MDW4820678.1 hypothetical protein [Shewanella fidelis]MDW4824900.1 hypothetical protein [Shewanella fidelis]